MKKFWEDHKTKVFIIGGVTLAGYIYWQGVKGGRKAGIMATIQFFDNHYPDFDVRAKIMEVVAK